MRSGYAELREANHTAHPVGHRQNVFIFLRTVRNELALHVIEWLLLIYGINILQEFKIKSRCET